MTLSSKEGSYAPRLIIEHDGVPKSARATEIADHVSVYPNPTTGMVNISINDLGFTHGTVKVVSAYGAIIKTQTITYKEANINLQDYNPGFYFIIIDYNGNTITNSVVKE